MFLRSTSMPRRSTPDPLAERIGARIRVLRNEAGLTLEKLAYESEVGSKGFLSDVEKGLARPTVETLQAIADRLEMHAQIAQYLAVDVDLGFEGHAKTGPPALRRASRLLDAWRHSKPFQ